MPLVGGNGCVNGRIGYVEQKPWIMNATFRENVLMGADYDEAWFAQVVDVCALAMDVRLFPDGDMTMMCRSGVNLFGEQKARLALARALYLKADVYVLDDLLSAVDAEVERHIVERVLLPGGIVGQKTRILVTHAEHLVLFGDIIITFANGIMSAVEQVPIAISSYSRSAADPKADVSEESAGPADNESQKTDKSSKHSEQQAGSLVLNSLSFVVRGMEKIGIVGRTGGGKSSLTFALLRLVEADSGNSIIDGIDISTIGLRDLRSRISIIPQDPALFQGTIRDNLDPLHQYTNDEMWAAIKACQISDLLEVPTDKYTKKLDLNVYDFFKDGDLGEWIEGTGLAKWVEYNGSNFSVGQRQLVSLCRALLWRRKIPILDEATANIDSKTDKIMQAVIRREFVGCTVLTIAHRLNTIMDSDRVLVMDQGEFAEFDTPANLLAQNSHFTRLVECVDLNHSHQPPGEN
ncbi:hypothetical protein GGI02_002112 [Coemansia sp. RSA 2322]|nr:hypothetical protein GGI02_002112 [Coemansia sp. RSA 2322]